MSMPNMQSLQVNANQRRAPTRPNRHLRDDNTPFLRIPAGIGVEEGNVSLGLGSQVLGAAGAFTLQTTVPRPVILRDLIVACSVVRGRVTSFQAAGVTLLLGSSAPVEAFSPLCQNRPSIDLPVYTGAVTITGTMDAACTIDAQVSID